MIGAPRFGTVLEETANTVNAAVPYPSTIYGADLLVACLSSSSGSGSSLTAPSNLWTQVGQFASTGSSAQPAQGIWYAFATGYETGNAVFTCGSNTVSGVMMAWSGVDLSSPLDVPGYSFVDQTAAQNTSTVPGVTVVTPGSAAVCLGSYQSVTATATTPPSGFVEIADRTQVSARTFEVSYAIGLPNGATGNQVITWSSALGRSIAMTIILRPALQLAPTSNTGRAALGFRRGRRRN